MDDPNRGECWLCGLFGHDEKHCPNVVTPHRPLSPPPRPALYAETWYRVEVVAQGAHVRINRAG